MCNHHFLECREVNTYQNSAKAPNLASACESIFESRLDILTKQNTSLQRQVARIDVLERDLRKTKCVLHKVDLDRRTLARESIILGPAFHSTEYNISALIDERENLVRLVETSNHLKDKAKICVFGSLDKHPIVSF